MVPCILLVLVACTTVEPAPLSLAPQDLMETPPGDRSSKQPPSAATFDRCVGHDGALTVRGRVFGKGGTPVAGVPIGQMRRDGSYEHLTLTGDDGSYAVDVRSPAVVTVSHFGSVPGTVCAASDEEAEGPVVQSGVSFAIAETQPLDLVFVDDEGAPVPGVVIDMTSARSSMYDRPWPVASDAEGRLRVRRVGELTFSARSPRFINQREGLPVPLKTDCSFGTGVCVEGGEPGPLTVPMTPAVRVKGHVRSREGAPVPDARASFLPLQGQMVTVESDADGAFTTTVDPSMFSNGSATASADGFFQEARVSFTLDAPASGSDGTWSETTETIDGEEVVVHTFDFVLDSARMVDVGCAGLHGEGCSQLMPMVCASLNDADVQTHCFPDAVDWTYACTCPREEPVVIRAGGLAVRVPDDATYTWMDFRRFGGGVRGTVPDGRWRVVAKRAGIQFPHGLTQRHQVTTRDGSFELRGLPPGDYKVSVEPAGEMGVGTVMEWFTGTRGVAVEVGDEVVDMGAITD